MIPDRQALADMLGCEPSDINQVRTIGGGDTALALRVDRDGQFVFLKLCPAANVSAVEAEALDLKEMASHASFRVPGVQGYGASGRWAWLALDWLTMSGDAPRGGAALGRALAQMHQVTKPRFGLERDNFIGRSPQRNKSCASWANFFADQRLATQRDIGEKTGLEPALIAALEKLIDAVPTLLANHAPAASLVHGDLWGGNWSVLTDGTPVLFDPALYYGDREVDLAMTQLFGGFPDSFYRAYYDVHPRVDGDERRALLYNIYHIVNHANLFGGGYVAQARRSIDRVLGQ